MIMTLEGNKKHHKVILPDYTQAGRNEILNTVRKTIVSVNVRSNCPLL